MAARRYTFGAGVSDFVASVSTTGGFLWIRPDQTIYVYADADGVTQLSDLLVGGVGATSLTTDSLGNVPEFQGPVGYSALYIGVPGSLRLVVANDLNVDVEQAVTDAADALATVVDVSTHEARITANEASVTSHGTRLTTAEGEIDVLQSDMTNHTHPIADLQATGTPSASTFLRGDGVWGTPAGGGSGTGEVDTVNGVAPDAFGNVVLTPANIGAPALAVTNDLDATKADLAGPQTHTGTHTFATIAATTGTFSGNVTAANLYDTTTQNTRFAAYVKVTTGSEARPTGADFVLWSGGTTQPTNMAVGDAWIAE